VLLSIVYSLSTAQVIQITFSGTGEESIVESVVCTNLSTNSSIELPGTETLILSTTSGNLQNNDIAKHISIYPNPFEGMTSISFSKTYASKTTISVCNLSGQEILKWIGHMQIGNHKFRISLKQSGIYLFRVIGDENITSKVVSVKPSGSNNITYLGNFHSKNKIEAVNQSNYILSFKPGDWIHYKGKSGIYTTIVTDSVETSKDIIFDFVDCTDPNDKSYEVVRIGDQIWMAENYEYLPWACSPLLGSDHLPYFYSSSYAGFASKGANQNSAFKNFIAYYNNVGAYHPDDPDSKDNIIQGICPPGWHLPSKQEWEQLISYLGTNAGGKLKEVNSNTWEQPNKDATNTSGFSAKPGGYINPGQTYSLGGLYDFNEKALFFTTEKNYYSAKAFSLNFQSGSASFKDVYPTNGINIRCLKNQSHQNASPDANFDLIVVSINDNMIEVNALETTDSETEFEDLLFRWDWHGDDQWDTEFSLIPSIRHSYDSCGTYLVRLEVLDRNGNSDQVTKLIKIPETYIVDQRDQEIYAIVEIGNQWWMAENLRYLPEVYPSFVPEGWSGSQKSYYVYGYEGNNVNNARKFSGFEEYGVLYNYYAALAACPRGWRLPSDTDWKTLESALGMSDQEIDRWGNRTDNNVGTKLKSRYRWESGPGTNSEKFDALPGGNFNIYLSHNQYSSSFTSRKERGYYWTSTESSYPIVREFDSDAGIYRSGSASMAPGMSFHRGFSVRCVKDE
jgi:uncharacterized protein (TIGR02145 family)